MHKWEELSQEKSSNFAAEGSMGAKCTNFSSEICTWRARKKYQKTLILGISKFYKTPTYNRNTPKIGSRRCFFPVISSNKMLFCGFHVKFKVCIFLFGLIALDTLPPKHCSMPGAVSSAWHIRIHWALGAAPPSPAPRWAAALATQQPPRRWRPKPRNAIGRGPPRRRHSRPPLRQQLCPLPPGCEHLQELPCCIMAFYFSKWPIGGIPDWGTCDMILWGIFPFLHHFITIYRWFPHIPVPFINPFLVNFIPIGFKSPFFWPAPPGWCFSHWVKTHQPRTQDRHRCHQKFLGGFAPHTLAIWGVSSQMRGKHRKNSPNMFDTII